MQSTKARSGADSHSETCVFSDRTVRRIGYGAMQLAGPGVFGPPKDHEAAPGSVARGS